MDRNAAIVAAETTEEPPKIWVMASDSLGPGQVALNERDRHHPKTGIELPEDQFGEVYVYRGGPPAKVARTFNVMSKLRNEELVLIPESMGEELLAAWEEEQAARAERAAALQEGEAKAIRAAAAAQAEAAGTIQMLQAVAVLQLEVDRIKEEGKADKDQIKELQNEIKALRKAGAEDQPSTTGEATGAVTPPATTNTLVNAGGPGSGADESVHVDAGEAGSPPAPTPPARQRR